MLRKGAWHSDAFLRPILQCASNPNLERALERAIASFRKWKSVNMARHELAFHWPLMYHALDDVLRGNHTWLSYWHGFCNQVIIFSLSIVCCVCFVILSLSQPPDKAMLAVCALLGNGRFEAMCGMGAALLT